MSVSENASLVLNSVNCSSTNSIKSSFTWNNINLRSLLGDMYDKYDRFNLCLNTIASAYTLTGLTGATNNQCLIRVSGLPFVNNTYNISSSGLNVNNSSTIIATFTFSSSAPAVPITQYFYGSNIATFSKNSDITSITIDYVRVYDLLTPDSTNSFPQMTFIFDIFGIDDYKTNDVSRRIKI